MNRLHIVGVGALIVALTATAVYAEETLAAAADSAHQAVAATESVVTSPAVAMAPAAPDPVPAATQPEPTPEANPAAAPADAAAEPVVEDTSAAAADFTPQAVAAAEPAVTSPSVAVASEASNSVPAAAKPEPAPEANPAAVPADAMAEPIVIDYNEADIQSVLRTLAAKAGINLILGDEVTGKVSVHLEGVSYEDAMRMVVESKGYAYVKDRNVVRVKSKESIDTEPVELRIYTLNYSKADDVRKVLEPIISKQGRIQVDTRGNTLVISDTPSNLAKLIPLIQSLDTQTPQVLIEAKFIETTKNPKKDLGINWDQTLLNHPLSAGPFTLTKDLSGGAWVPSTVLLDAGSVRVLMSYLNRDANTELLASPRVVTTDNGKAKVAIATQYPIPNFQFSESTGAFQINGFEYKDIGITLTVTPRINKNDFVTLEVTPEASDQNGTATLASGGSSVEIPIIDTRTATTTVLIKSGNTLVIGGLMREDVVENYTKVPLFGDIPGLGAFFRSKSLSKFKRDLLIFVTPTIVNPESQTDDEKYYGGLPHKEIYTNDKWMPHDNAQPNPRNLMPWASEPAPTSANTSVHAPAPQTTTHANAPQTPAQASAPQAPKQASAPQEPTVNYRPK
jgi:type IV pilus assembly protein PilQ